MKVLHFNNRKIAHWAIFLLLFPISSWACKKDPVTNSPKKDPRPIQLLSIKWNATNVYSIIKNAPTDPTIRLNFSAPLDTQIAKNSIKIKLNGVVSTDALYRFENGDSTVIIKPLEPLKYYSKYTLSIPNTVASSTGAASTTGASSTTGETIASSVKLFSIFSI